jgi:indole-3-glycerol phosphate synthase
VSDSRRLSQAISEGDGISVLAEVRDDAAARAAQDQGAEGLVLRGLVDGVRDVSQLPVLVYGPSLRDAADAAADAVVLVADREDQELVDLAEQAVALGLEVVLKVSDEDDFERALEHLDPEIFLLSPEESDDEELPVTRVLELLPDVPAGKLAIAELAGASRLDVEELERAGVDAVLVAVEEIGPLVGDIHPEV